MENLLYAPLSGLFYHNVVAYVLYVRLKLKAEGLLLLTLLPDFLFIEARTVSRQK